MRSTIGLSAICGAIVAVSSEILTAGGAFADTIETVVVTAERRVEPLFLVPGTVTAIGGDQIKDLGYTDMKSVIALVPNAVLPDDPENFEPFINIRGVHQSDINAEPNFGLYRNGIFSGGERGNLGPQIDIDRVEILSGPQSGLYGRDAVGGVVNVIYATPTMDDLHGYVIASYGRYENSQLQGAINVPLTDNLAIRGAAWWINQNQGQLFDPTINRFIDAHRSFGGRLSAQWNAMSDLSVLWTAELQNVHGPSFTAFSPTPLGATFGVQCCGLLVQPAETLHTITEDTPNVARWSQLYLAQDVNYDTHSWAGTFEWQSAYKNYDLHLQEDQDHTAFAPSDGPFMVKQVQFRDEGLHNFYTDLLWKSPPDQRFTWILGADYFDESFRFDRIFTGSIDFTLMNTPAFGPGFTYWNLACLFLMAPHDGGCESFGGFPGLPPNSPFPIFPFMSLPPNGVQSAANAFGAPGSSIDTQSISGFATATYNLTEQLSVTADLRWDQSRKHLHYINGPVPGFGATPYSVSYLGPLFAQVVVPFVDVQTRTFVNLAPSVRVQYKITDTANVYALYAEGFRAGGFNVTTSTPAFLPYKSEKNASYEIGTKTVWLDGKLGVNADVFFMRQYRLLEFVPDPVAPPFLGLGFLSNIGNATTWGAELSSAYQPYDWLHLAASVGWLDDVVTCPKCVPVRPHQQIPLTRHWTINLSTGIDHPVSGEIRFVGDANLRLEFGGFLPASTSSVETFRYKNFNKLDLDAGVAFGETRVVAYANNVFNSVIPQFQFSDGVINVNEGLTYGVRLTQGF